MSALRWRAVVVLALMLSALAVAHAWRPTRHLADMRAKVDLEAVFPKQFGDWRIDDAIPVQLIAPDLQAVLDKIYNQVLSRTYINSNGEHILLSVAYGGDQSDGTRAHRPEVCYPAQGFQIVASEKSQIDVIDRTLPVRQLVARQGSRNEPITYWVTVGESIALSGTEQKLAQLRYTTRGIVPDGMLVRVSNIRTDVAASYAMQQDFIRQMAQAIDPALRAQVIGRSGA